MLLCYRQIGLISLTALAAISAIHFDRHTPLLLLHKAFGGFSDNNNEIDETIDQEQTKQDMKTFTNLESCSSCKEVYKALLECRSKLKSTMADPSTKMT